MKIIAPDYYPAFRCIADKCRHSCCIGWEIDIDPDTREKYRRIPGEFGARLNASIVDDGISTFRLGDGGRCPMLNPSGLCDLITELGEEHLCQICADHPRFRNFYTDRTEIGLGLCCEEAARLILTQEKPMRLITLEEDGTEDALSEEEEDLLAIRDTLICTMQDRSIPLCERLDELLVLGGLTIPEKDWPSVYRDLERLDPLWDGVFDLLAMPPQPLPRRLEAAIGNFTVYLLYRHIPGAMEDEDIPGRVAFCVLSAQILMALCAAKPECTTADLINFARMYSAEIEYDEDNIAALLDALWEAD